MNYCPGCLAKQLEIDRLRAEIERLKDRLRYQERTALEGPFGLSTPSSKVPVKPSAEPEQSVRAGGARAGHPGCGRQVIVAADVEVVRHVSAPQRCPDCGGPLQAKGTKRRAVLDVQPLRRRRICYELEQQYCARCRKLVAARAPGVLERNLLSNRLLAHVAVEHYVQGVTLGHLEGQLQVGCGTLIGGLHQLARRLEPACAKLAVEYRRAPVKHADETSWRNDGHNGYAWLFRTETLSLFRFRRSRSAQVVHQVLGRRRLPGVLLVDRYGAYNHAPCALQYCYAHLLREVEALEREFPAQAEVARFVERLAPLLARAMHLRGLHLSQKQFLAQARQTEQEIRALARAPAQHPGIQKIQQLFREKSRRLFHWAKDRQVPADNNRCERELRPLVIARKISFGSQSEAGAHTREVLMSVLHTLRKRTDDVRIAFLKALDRLVEAPTCDPYAALFRLDSS